MITPQIPKGFRDFLPRKMAFRQHIINEMICVFESFGFEPLDTPCLEYAEMLEGKYGEDGEKLIYKFEDRGGRAVALRYDLTIPLSRVVAMYPEIPRPFKRYQIAPVWRADKPQKGRFREFYQCDIDIVGSESPYADAELLIITFEVLTRLGFENFIMRINSRKILNALALKTGVAGERIPAFLRAIDKLDKIGVAEVLKEMRSLKLLEQKDQEELVQRMLAEDCRFDDIAGRISDMPEGAAGVSEMECIMGALRAHGVPEHNYRFDICLARGLDYYTGPIFETVVREPQIGSITGGGRYDDLIGLYARYPVPATGSSFGLERLVAVCEELGMLCTAPSKVHVLLTAFDEASMAVNVKNAKVLREQGINTEVYLSPHKLKKQLSYAAGRGIPVVAILGPDEISNSTITLRNMARGEQTTVSQAGMVKMIKAMLGQVA